ncbi:ribosome-binding protein MDM38 KNAG_0L01040 [Huiozyma naganishii CBS 8797]|uniref:Letm1 RBD domain-containing protein n=1 Tax=Huiozyma naganishii (strain ATCC MYA-139 / BCRC 22969 / CBS 8797 / KCTC 17520 / NBRC 10181 / NCYC 3082 / Yp74L-3) TaxID=1071383 RepID=J7RCX0_HUIN7|nr:hypothetical protein KNAG_0L01040 [Kazachstania naganishii CBS 8797]CCK72725.1 hypothetical protein KNAG_0L01040 [Kazachstania naganishii CBS 8797]
MTVGVLGRRVNVVVAARAYAAGESGGAVKKAEAVKETEKKLVKTTPVPVSRAKPSLLVRIRNELKHYAHGTRLLGYEVKVSTGLLAKFIRGSELSRRETNQLRRTMGDVLRLIPFSAFLIVPFAELLLPVALKLFPNLLPSTYESGSQRQKKVTRLIEIRKKTSALLHQTLGKQTEPLINYDAALQTHENKLAFSQFFYRLHQAKRVPSQTTYFSYGEINSVAKMFKNDSVLDNLSRTQLTAMSKFMSVTPFGTDNMLRYHIRHKLKKIIQDDKTIDYEGVDHLTKDELYTACVSRGVKAYGVDQDVLRDHLRAWLQLRLRMRVPSVLMVLSSTFTFGRSTGQGQEAQLPYPLHNVRASDPEVHEKEMTRYDRILDTYYDGILQVLGSIPDPVYNVAKLDLSETMGGDQEPATAGDETEDGEQTPKKDDSEFKLNVLKEQQELIRREQEEATARKSQEDSNTDTTTLDEDDATKQQPPVPLAQAAKTAVDKRH